MKSSKVSIKTRSTPASLSFKGQASKHTTVKSSIPPGPKLQITSSSIVSSSSLSPLWTPGFKKCAVCEISMFLQ